MIEAERANKYNNKRNCQKKSNFHPSFMLLKKFKQLRCYSNSPTNIISVCAVAYPFKCHFRSTIVLQCLLFSPLTVCVNSFRMVTWPHIFRIISHFIRFLVVQRMREMRPLFMRWTKRPLFIIPLFAYVIYLPFFTRFTLIHVQRMRDVTHNGFFLLQQSE